MAIIKITESGNTSNNAAIEFHIENPEILDAYFAEKIEEKAYETDYEIYTVKNNTETLSMLAAKFKSVLQGKALEQEIVLINALKPNSDGEYVLLQQRQLGIPIKKEVGIEVSFKAISKISQGKEYYLIIETKNFRGKSIQTQILEGGKESSMLGVKQSISIIDEKGQSQQFVTARVGAWSRENKVINSAEFRDWAIASFKLVGTHAGKEKNIQLSVDAFSANEYFNKDNNHVEKLDYRGKSAIPFGIKNYWFGLNGEPFELI